MRKIFIITIFLFLFSTFANAQAQMMYLFLEVVDSKQKPVAEAEIESSSLNRWETADKTTGQNGIAKFSAMNRYPDLSLFRIFKPDYYNFNLFGLLRPQFFESSYYGNRNLKVELLKIPKSKDEKQLLGDEQLKRDFFSAVLKGDSAEVRSLLKSGINPNITTDDLRGVPAPKEIPAMLYAANNADIAVMNEFLSAKIDLRKGNSNIRNLLAYYIGNLNNHVNTKEQLPVFNDYVERLIKAGASLKATDAGKQPLLMIAAQQNNVELIRKLIKKGVNVNAKDENGSTALADFIYKNAYSATDDRQIEIIRTLLEAGANPNIFNEGYNGDCEFPLKTLARYGRLELVKLFLSYKANPILKCKNGRNVLSDLTTNKGDHNYPEVANILIDAGLDVNTASEYRTPLMIAASSGNLSIVKKTFG